MIKNKPKPNTHKVIFLRKDLMLSEIEDQLEIVAQSRATNGLPLAVLSSAGEKYHSQLIRLIDKYLAKAKSRMSAYIVVPEHKAEMNGEHAWEEIAIDLSFPPTWNATTFSQLVDAVHDYIVNSVLFEMFTLTITANDPVTASKEIMAEEANSMIKHCLVSSLPGTQRKKLHPF